MPVSSSTFTLEGPQADGSRWCREVHSLTNGPPVEFYYLTPAEYDPTPHVNARAAIVNEEIAEREADKNFNRDGALILNHQTAAQFATRLREKFRDSSKEEVCQLAYWILRRITAGHITDAQARNAFGMTAGQWTTFKTNKLTPRSNAWATLLAAVGE